jgi:hypothetical protein
MKVPTLVVILLCASTCVAQSKNSVTTPLKAANAQTAQCKTDLMEATAVQTQLQERNKELEARNAELSKKIDDAKAILIILHKEMTLATLTEEDQKRAKELPASEILDLSIVIEKDRNEYLKVFQTLAGDNESAVKKYNSLLADYKDYVDRVGLQFAKIGAANRASNALALYSVMPRYTPPATINLNVRNCTQLPALCVQ